MNISIQSNTFITVEFIVKRSTGIKLDLCTDSSIYKSEDLNNSVISVYSEYPVFLSTPTTEHPSVELRAEYRDRIFV